MPEINLIPEVLYNPENPYHFHFDNLPLKNILQRIDLVNAQVDINANILRGASGSAGTLSVRLSKSLEDNGDLKSTAVNSSLHNIAYHEDGTKDSISYVRMTKDERDKLSTVDSDANDISIKVESISTSVLFNNGTVHFKDSDSIQFTIEAPSVVKATTNFPSTAAHQHYYDLEPAHATPSSPDYQNYKTTSLGTAFVSNTLRVYVNGIRLSSDESVRVPDISTASTWTLTYINSETPASGLFSLNRALTASDVIRIDFDQSFV